MDCAGFGGGGCPKIRRKLSHPEGVSKQAEFRVRALRYFMYFVACCYETFQTEIFIYPRNLKRGGT